MSESKATPARAINPLRMLGVIGAFLKLYWRGLAYIIAMPVVVTFGATFVFMVLVNIPSAIVVFVVGSVYAGFVAMVSVGMSVSTQRLVLLGEAPPRPFGYAWGRRELRMLAHALWLLVMWGIGFFAVIAFEVIFFGYEKGQNSGFGALAIISLSWVLTMAVNMPRLLAMPRIAAGLEDTRLRLTFRRLMPYLALPGRIKDIAKGHGLALAGTWTLLSVAVIAGSAIAMAAAEVLGDSTSSNVTGLLSLIGVWYAMLSVLSLGAALLYLRLGGEVSESDAPPATLEADGESV